MSKYFVQPEDGIGPGGDVVFRKHGAYPDWYHLCLNETKIGQVMRGRDKNWIGLSNSSNSEFFGIRMIEGFANRMAAATFVIKHHGYWMQDERERREQFSETINNFRPTVNISGVVTANQINESVGNMIQRSSRFKNA